MTSPIYRQTREKIRYWTDAHSRRFEILGTYSPNEDNDTWVEYRNQMTGETYNCRLEAFTSRFTPLPD